MNRIKEIRQKEGLSQQALAKKIGVSYRTIQNWENGVNQIKPDKAQQLANFFKVGVGYLLGYNDEEKEKLERWTKINIDEIIKKDYSLDLGLIKDESLLDVETLPNPILNTNETIEKLEEAIDLLKSVVNELKNCGLSEED